MGALRAPGRPGRHLISRRRWLEMLGKQLKDAVKLFRRRPPGNCCPPFALQKVESSLGASKKKLKIGVPRHGVGA